jgi:benzoate membrane transport protein
MSTITHSPIARRPGLRLEPEALSAGLSAFLMYTFAAFPALLAVLADLELGLHETAAWITAVWLTGGIATLAVTLRTRQPVPLVWSFPCLAYLGSVGHGLGYRELVGASLVAGVGIVLLALLGAGERIMAWLPLPLVVATFAGSIAAYVLAAARATVTDAAIGCAAVGAYAAARALRSRRVPPVAVAAVAAAVAVVALGRVDAAALEWSAPALSLPAPSFSGSVILASLPLIVLSLGMSTVQGLGFLVSEGYRVPVNRISLAVGLTSVANALLGGHPAGIGRNAAVLVGGPEAGPLERRYRASVVSGVLLLGLALGAGTIAALVGSLPPSVVAVVGGLALLSPFEDALRKSFRGGLPLGATAAFAVAATPVAILGIGSAFWALIAGYAVSLLLERGRLRAALGAYRTATRR